MGREGEREREAALDCNRIVSLTVKCEIKSKKGLSDCSLLMY